MGRYSEERRTAVLSKLLPPYNGVVSQVAREEGICTATLYNWLKSARKRGVAVPGSRKKTAEDWSGEAKLAVAGLVGVAGAGIYAASKHAVLWLCSDKSSFVTGTPMCIDGGITAQ